jgi:prepilin-type N-terminal cleavage/methylation domain-containing protein
MTKMHLVRNSDGFTLAELMLVLLMLGLLAAIVLPKFTNAQTEAGESTLKANLRALRRAITLYENEHYGTYPAEHAAGGAAAAGTPAAFVAQLTRYSGAAGATSDTRDATHVFGPYLRTGIPPATVGSIRGDNSVKVVNAAGLVPDKSTGWLYSTVSGRIIANTDELAADGTAFSSW